MEKHKYEFIKDGKVLYTVVVSSVEKLKRQIDSITKDKKDWPKEEKQEQTSPCKE